MLGKLARERRDLLEKEVNHLKLIQIDLMNTQDLLLGERGYGMVLVSFFLRALRKIRMNNWKN